MTVAKFSTSFFVINVILLYPQNVRGDSRIMFREILSYIAEFCRGTGVNLVNFINIVK